MNGMIEFLRFFINICIRRKNRVVLKRKHPWRIFFFKSLFIKGTGNVITIENEKRNRHIGELKVSINGTDNVIFFHGMKKYNLDLTILIHGNKNVVNIFNPKFKNSFLEISGDNNSFILEDTVKEVVGMDAFVADGSSIIIKKDCEIGNDKLVMVANGCYNTTNKIFIDEGTHIARDAIIRTSDGECLVDAGTGEPLSVPQDVCIGKHCWITSRCTILKGASLPDGTVVAANSLVNKKFDIPDTLIGGIPAGILRRNIRWAAGSYKTNMERYNHGQ